MNAEARLELMKYLGEILHKPFVPVEHDCLTFTNKCWEIMYGYPWSSDWLGGYFTDNKRPLTIPQLQKKFGFEDLPEAIDSLAGMSRFTPAPDTDNYLGSGKLVIRKVESTMIGYAMGISLGRSLVYLGFKGLDYHSPEYYDLAWQRVENK